MNPLFLCSPASNGFYRFTFDTTPADLLVASMEAEPFLIYVLAHIQASGTLIQHQVFHLYSVTDTLRMNNADLLKYEIHMHENTKIDRS